jgi:hypothetical protein
VYPGFIRGIPRDIGLWSVYTRHNELRIGLVSRRALSLGVGYGQ